ncbi:hypothetical protein [Streptomyces sp. HC307]
MLHTHPEAAGRRHVNNVITRNNQLAVDQRSAADTRLPVTS